MNRIKNSFILVGILILFSFNTGCVIVNFNPPTETFQQDQEVSSTPTSTGINPATESSTPSSQNKCSFSGTWNWVNGKYLLTINDDGTAKSKEKNGDFHYATWKYSPDRNHITITWEDGWWDVVQLSYDCSKLEGYNTEGALVSGYRIY